MSEIIKTGVSQGVILEDYKGSYSLVSAWEDKDGKVNLKWGKFEVYDNKTKTKSEKNLPVKIYIGNRDMAIEVLGELINRIKGKPESSEDVPF